MMREGRQLARESKRFAEDQRGRSWFHLLTTIGAFVVVLTVACSGIHWGLRLVASVVAALIHVRLFVIYHDYQHGAIFADSKIAGAFFRFYGLLSLSPANVWKHTHDHHHRNNSRRFGMDSVGSFPVMTTDDYRKANSGARFLYAFSRHPMTIAFGYVTVFFFGFCVQPLLTNPRKHLDSVAAIVLHFGLIVLLSLTRPDILLFGLLIPTFIASAVGSYLFYAQHNFPGVTLRTGEEWDHIAAALNSSSFLRMGPLMSWFTANIGYHHVHHLNARIPFYRLPETMAALEELQSPVTTTLRPSDILRCLRLNLWDVRRKCLVSFAAAEASATATV